MATVASISVGRPMPNPDPRSKCALTGIAKQPVEAAVRLAEDGVAGDTVVDRKNHGRWFQAVYAFAADELDWWAAELGRPMPPGAVGENLTVTGMDCSFAVIGERWRLGSAVLRVTGPRTPCRTFAEFWGVRDLIKRFTVRGRTGAYLAVEQPGEVRAGEAITVLDRPDHAVTVAEVFAVDSGARGALAAHVRAALPDLPPEWAAPLARKIA